MNSFVMGSVAVWSWYGRGTVVVRSRYGRGTVETNMNHNCYNCSQPSCLVTVATLCTDYGLHLKQFTVYG